MLDVEGAYEILQEAEVVLEIDDETDLQEAASFDIAAFMQSTGVDVGILATPEAKSLPNVLV